MFRKKSVRRMLGRGEGGGKHPPLSPARHHRQIRHPIARVGLRKRRRAALVGREHFAPKCTV